MASEGGSAAVTARWHLKTTQNVATSLQLITGGKSLPSDAGASFSSTEKLETYTTRAG